MKKFVIYVLLSLTTIVAKAKTNPDSLAYQFQRKTINDMLDKRRQKFGQYDESLGKHTGIFGFQTKKDIRRSNDILMNIVKTDDEIFRQLKILLDFRVFQQTQAETHSTQVANDVLAYMTTINKLRNQLDKVKKAADDEERQSYSLHRTWFIIGLVLIVLIVIFISKKPRV